MFVRVAGTGELWSGEMMPCSAGGRRLLLVKLDEAIYAYEDRCAHLGIPLSQGKLAGRVLTCRAHEWQYDIATGRGINPARARLVRFPVRIDGSDILVDMEGRLS